MSGKVKEVKHNLVLDNGEQVNATYPVIVSASRSTDIPAFYADWFFERLKKGYSVWTNPYNGKRHYIAYADTRFIVFWSKNPKPLLRHLDYLDERKIGCYIQFSLNDYEKERLEPMVPKIAERLATFAALVSRLGKGRVIWRFDPLVLMDTINIDILLERVRRLGGKLHQYTEELVFSFVDILSYSKVKANLKKSGIAWSDWTTDQMREFARRLVEMNRAEGWNLQLATCGETVDLPGIAHNRCIDDRLIARFGHDSPELMQLIGAEVCLETCQGSLMSSGTRQEDRVDLGNGQYALLKKYNKDKGQRDACGCIKSKDIGQYNTCMHLCEYCYANAGKDSVRRNYDRHTENPHGETITGL